MALTPDSEHPSLGDSSMLNAQDSTDTSRAPTPNGLVEAVNPISADEGQEGARETREGESSSNKEIDNSQHPTMVPRATDSPTNMTQGDSAPVVSVEAQATSQGGAIAGPGPSSSLKRSPSPLPSPSVAARPVKKKRGKAAIPLNHNSYSPPPFPHYTIERCLGTNSKKNRHVIRINPDATDGSPMKWPLDREFDSGHKVKGKEYWYEREPKELANGKHRAQLEKIGDELAAMLKLYDHENTQEFWILDSFPTNYIFTIHHCVTASSNQSRTDPYVFGCPMTVRFRSANEIIPHLFWLISHGPGNHLRCACKYCSKKTQAEVNKLEGLSVGRASTPTVQVPPPPKLRRNTSNLGTVATSSSSTTSNNFSATDSKKPHSKSLDTKPRPTYFAPDTATNGSKPCIATTSATTSEANNTKPLVRSRTFNSSSPEPSYSGAFVDKQRDSDLLPSSSMANRTAKYRRGEMVWARVPRGELTFSQGQGHGGYDGFQEEQRSHPQVRITHWPAIIETREERTESSLLGKQEDVDDREGYKVGSGVVPRFENKKRWVYHVIYLATQSKGSTVEEDQIHSWLEMGPPDHVWTDERLSNPESVKAIWNGSKLQKVKMDDVNNLEQAVAPLALAIQIASYVSSSFSVVDRFIIKDSHFVLPPYEDSEEAGADHYVDEEVLSQMARAKNNWFYQSVYFGAELIWVNEFVRIISCPDLNLPPHHRLSKGSKSRSLFMQIQSIYKEQELAKVKYSGQLYELRDLMQHEEGAGIGAIGADIGGLGAMSVFEKSPSSQAKLALDGIGDSNGHAHHPVADTSLAVTEDEGDIELREGREESFGVDETSTPPKSSSAFYSVPLPPAPEGFEFHRITPGESQVAMSLDYLAGRYYPLPRHLDSRHKIDELLAGYPQGPEYEEIEDDGRIVDTKNGDLQMTESHRAIALAGLVPAYNLYGKATRWKGDRATAIVDAEVAACQDVAGFFEHT